MAFWNKKSFRFALIVFFSAFVIFLLYMMLTYKDCQDVLPREPLNCQSLHDKYPGEALTSESKVAGLEEVIEKYVVEVDQKDMPGFNGFACGGRAFVSSSLPYFSKQYVKEHEALHLLGNDNETSVNIQAGISRPFGMAQTIIHSVLANFSGRRVGEYPCVVNNIWSIFKRYFLFN